ncbi:hypothetical protein [Mucilaginibacter endophyticus]|uniref:hypothetical protein n=1 Tax=Mucilaginibacter endophyticus TaxID=2675003 RepID=UPI000E0CE90F|nr:hypothetical protein [Mucilaginibacter endophyticus]
MKKLITVLITAFSISIAMAQSDSVHAVKRPLVTNATDSLYRHLPNAKEKQPLVIVNSNIISGLSYINPNDITSLTVLKSKDVPAANLANLSRFGVILITLKKEAKIETNTFNDIKKRFNIDGKVRFALDGYFVDDESLLISRQDINEINLTWKKDKSGDADVTINIWMLAPDARKGIVYKPNPNDKPGTIHIR